jgi:hypothetical protein
MWIGVGVCAWAEDRTPNKKTMTNSLLKKATECFESLSMNGIFLNI